MKTPEVSVIIPTYNRSDLILQTIGSVLSQTYKNYEIIVVDDGSTDNTLEVLRSLIETEKIRYFVQKNQGESAARNYGIRESSGQYIAFLDSDDLWLPQKLELQVACIRENPETGLVQSSFSKFDGVTGDDLGRRDTGWFNGWIYPQILMHWKDLMAVDAVLVPKQVLEHVGGFDENFRIGPDLELWWRISRYYPFVAMPQVLTRVRVHTGNISAEKSSMSSEFRRCLDKAFSNDPSLSERLRRKTLARMYSYTAYNQLGNANWMQIGSVWHDAWSSIKSFPFEWNAYVCIFLSLVPFQLRLFMYKIWKRFRYKRIPMS